MNIQTLQKCLEFGDECISLGGGEPTVHPLFWQIIGLCLGSSEYIWLATNGKETSTALALANLAKKGVMGCALSQDEYHDRINPNVIIAFTKERRIVGINNNDLRSIRDVTTGHTGIINSGRCDFGVDGCVCEDLFVKPNGNTYGCGCPNSPCFGNVNEEYEIPVEYCVGECYKDQPEYTEHLELEEV